MKKIRFKRLFIRPLVLLLIITAIPFAYPKPTFADSAGSPVCTGIYCSIVGSKQGIINGSSYCIPYTKLSTIKGFNYESINALKTVQSDKDAPASVLTIIKDIDKASPKLLKAFSSSETLEEVKLVFIYVDNATGADYNGYTIKLTDAKIVKRSISVEHVINNYPGVFNYYENISLSYKSIEETNNMPDTSVSPTAVAGISCKMADAKKTGSNNAFIIDTFDYTSTGNVSFGTSSQSENKLDSSLLAIRKAIDNSSAAILKNFKSGEKIPEVTLYINTVSDTGEAMSYYTITLTNVVIVKRKLFAEPPAIGIAIQPYEEISLSYDSITETSSEDNTSTSVKITIDPKACR